MIKTLLGVSSSPVDVKGDRMDVLFCFPIAVINTMTESSVGEERGYLTYTSKSWSITERSRARSEAGTWRRKLKQSAYTTAADCFAPRLAVTYLCDLPRDDPVHSGLGLPTAMNKHRHSHRPM